MGKFSNHPSCLEAMHRLKNAMIGITLRPSKVSNSSETTTESSDFVTAGMLKVLMTQTTPPSPEVDPKPTPKLPEEIEQQLLDINPTIEQYINPTTWAEYSRSHQFKDRFNANAKEYVFGFIVNKLKQKHPDLVLETSLCDRVPKR